MVMAGSEPTFREASLTARPVRDLGLKIDGTALEPIVREFQAELERVGIRQLHPHFYLSTEWGVPFGTVSIAIPFYLANTDLTRLHAERSGFVEGVSRGDILRYLRHEMGHAVNYAYRLYDDPAWTALFGSIDQPYEEEYRPKPFDPRFVRHLPGWYAQKHPDEDWAETFAVWMTPGRDWRIEYAGQPVARAKLEYCDRTIQAVGDRPPVVNEQDPDESVEDLGVSLDEYYHAGEAGTSSAALPNIDGALRVIFEEYGDRGASPAGETIRGAAGLIRRLQSDLSRSVYRWTGHFPEHVQILLRHLADRAERLGLVYPAEGEAEAVATVELTALVTTLAMNHVLRGAYTISPPSLTGG
jgi:Putative zinc-binding metallo-peptidase